MGIWRLQPIVRASKYGIRIHNISDLVFRNFFNHQIFLFCFGFFKNYLLKPDIYTWYLKPEIFRYFFYN